GDTRLTGALGSANSLVGSGANDRVGSGGVTVLADGNYVVSSPEWDSGAVADVGAATWGSGASGVRGPIGPANSLVGSTAGDRVGAVTALANGNYVVSSPEWDSGAAADVGAVTWGSGNTGATGLIGS
ncbi:MAG: hypothetical protein GWO24_36560, partial [Akkermansiaceae bacterium]|nr:hypothetical protein [Akkermansiaceae bacterium]